MSTKSKGYEINRNDFKKSRYPKRIAQRGYKASKKGGGGTNLTRPPRRWKVRNRKSKKIALQSEPEMGGRRP